MNTAKFYTCLGQIYSQLAQLSKILAENPTLTNTMIGMRKDTQRIEFVHISNWSDDVYFEDSLGYGESLADTDDMYDQIHFIITEYLLKEDN